MTQYNTSRNKIRKSWDRTFENQNTIKNDLEKLTLDFNSINFTKTIETITLIENQLTPSAQNTITEIELVNFPEWILNHIKINSIVRSTDGFLINNIVANAFNAFQNGTLKLGDITFNSTYHWWFVKQNDGFILKIFHKGNLRRVDSLSGLGFSTEEIPMYIDLNLKIMNPRLYGLFNESKA